MFELEEANTSDLNAFWQFIKGLRKGKKHNIPQEVYMDDGVTVTSNVGKIIVLHYI